MTVNDAEFEIIKLLGKGKGGYSYLVQRDGMPYVLKQIHHEPCAYYQFGNKLESELRDYEKLHRIGIPMPELLDVDTQQERILKEYIPGDTVMALVKNDRDISFLTDQMREILSLLYPENLNIDYFPTNFVVKGEKMYYIDYECNTYSDEWNFENWGIRYWSKTPELMAYWKEHNG